MKSIIKRIRIMDSLNSLSIMELDDYCKKAGMRVGLWGYSRQYDPRKRDQVVLFKELEKRPKMGLYGGLK